MLARRQISVQRDNLASMCRISVKSLLDYACLYTHVDEDCEEFINFCAVFEQLVSHRLRPHQKVWLPGLGSPRHFWDVLLDNYHRSRTCLLPNCIPTIEAIEAFKSPKAKLRAFIRVALMEKKLSDYIFWLLDNRTLICESYLDGALLLSEEAAILCGDLIGLNAIDFNFCLKGNENELLGPLEISYSPFLKYKQTLASQCSDDIEMLRLNSKDMEDDVLLESNFHHIRLHSLEQNINHIKEQKDYLEELLRLRERQVQEANLKLDNLKLERQRAENSWEQAFRAMDACVLELQSELSKLGRQNVLLRSQVESMRKFKQRMEMIEVPLVDMVTGDDGEPGRTRETVENEDRFQKPSWSLKRSPMSPDQTSVVSGSTLILDDTHSLVPLAGSFIDVDVCTVQAQSEDVDQKSLFVSSVGETTSTLDEVAEDVKNYTGLNPGDQEGEAKIDMDNPPELTRNERHAANGEDVFLSEASIIIKEGTKCYKEPSTEFCKDTELVSSLSDLDLINSSSDGLMINSSDGVMISSSDGLMINSSDGVMISSSDGLMINSSDGVMIRSSGGSMINSVINLTVDSKSASPDELVAVTNVEEPATAVGTLSAMEEDSQATVSADRPDFCVTRNLSESSVEILATSETQVKEHEVKLGSESSSGAESEREEEGGMSDPEIINHSHSGSEGSDGAWDILSDAEQGETRNTM